MDHQISLNEAVAMTTRYRSYREAILQTQYQELNILPICETFDLGSVAAILEQEGVVKVRVYYGMGDDYKIHAILVGADDTGADILPTSATSTTETQGVILEDAQRCPPYCPPTSVLNDD